MQQAKEADQQGQVPSAWRRWALALILVTAIVGLALHFGEIQHFAELLKRARPAWLLAAAGLQALTYLCVAAGWRMVLRAAGSKIPIGKLFQLSLAKMFTDQAVPAAGLGGSLLMVDRLIAAGVPRGHAAAALILSTIGYYSGFTVLALTALLLLWLFGKASVLLVGVVAVFLLVCFAIPAGWVWLSRRGARPLPKRLAKIRAVRSLMETIGEVPPKLLGDIGLIARLAFFNAMVFVADAATLSVCLLAIGQPASVLASYVALIVAQMIVIIGPVPMGLGTFEGSCTGTLRLFGIGFEPALTATLLLRGFTLWLPLLPGLWVVRRLARKPGHRTPKREAVSAKH
jgi:uncharacterized protein (TIRG00374 family)